MTQTAVIALRRFGEWRIIAPVCAAHFVSHYYMIMLAPLFVFVRADYSVSYTDLAVALTAFSVVSATFQTPVGFLVDRVGARIVLSAGVALGAAAFAVAGLVDSFAAFALYGTSDTLANMALSGLLLMNALGVLVGGVLASRTTSHATVAALGLAFAGIVTALVGLKWLKSGTWYPVSGTEREDAGASNMLVRNGVHFAPPQS